MGEMRVDGLATIVLVPVLLGRGVWVLPLEKLKCLGGATAASWMARTCTRDTHLLAVH